MTMPVTKVLKEVAEAYSQHMRWQTEKSLNALEKALISNAQEIIYSLHAQSQLMEEHLYRATHSVMPVVKLTVEQAHEMQQRAKLDETAKDSDQ